MRNYVMNHWSRRFYSLLMSAGRSTGCHQDPNRSFKVKNVQFLLCARCTGVFLGYLVGFALAFVIRIPFLVCAGIMMIMFYDWYIQYLCIKESTNFRRCLTGIFYGTGTIHIIFWIIKKVSTIL